MDPRSSKEAFIESLFDDTSLLDKYEACSDSNMRGAAMMNKKGISTDDTQPLLIRNGEMLQNVLTSKSVGSMSTGQDERTHTSPTEVDFEDDSDWIPTEGMSFANVIEAFIKYSEYGRRYGFEVRFRSSELSPKSRKSLEDAGIKIPRRQRTNRGIGMNWRHDGYEFCSKVRFQCVKGAVLKTDECISDRPVRTQATSCSAGIYLAKKGEGNWELRKVRLEHNHECHPNSTRFMRSFRMVSAVDEMQIITSDRAGVTPARGYMNFVVGQGGIENVPFSVKDSQSILRRWRINGMDNGDFNAMQKFFNEMKALSADFTYSYDTDGEGRLKNVFWADARSRAAYADFGDVLCFDTTHLKNRYRMPLGLFIGVNHHGQSILFGCALLSNEDTESFKWVFETWLSCMRNSSPKYIMTDQCQAIGNAIKLVFPNARHRWCLWHIIKNAETHLRKHKEWDEIRKELSDIIHCACDPAEFEGMWSNFVHKFQLEGIDWIARMYELRGRWVPAYFVNEFWAGLHSTQRSEGMNNFFKSYVNINTGLKQFAEQYCVAIGKRVDDEERENWKSKNKVSKCATFFKFETIFQRCYTGRKFVEFQNEAKAVAYVNTERVTSDSELRVHIVTDSCAQKGLGRKGTRKFEVRFEVDSKISCCACKMFEFRGIICRHIVKVWQSEEVEDISSIYIVDRWRKDKYRQCSAVRIPNYSHAYDLSDDAKRCTKLQTAMRGITNLAMGNDRICNAVMGVLEKLQEKCSGMLSECDQFVQIDSLGRHYTRSTPKSPSRDQENTKWFDLVLDPIDRRGKGRVPERRKGAKKGKRKRSKAGGAKLQGGSEIHGLRNDTEANNAGHNQVGTHQESSNTVGSLQIQDSSGHFHIFMA